MVDITCSSRAHQVIRYRRLGVKVDPWRTLESAEYEKSDLVKLHFSQQRRAAPW